MRQVVTKRCSGPSDAARFLHREGFKKFVPEEGKVEWKRVRNNHVQVAKSEQTPRGGILIRVYKEE